MHEKISLLISVLSQKLTVAEAGVLLKTSSSRQTNSQLSAIIRCSAEFLSTLNHYLLLLRVELTTHHTILPRGLCYSTTSLPTADGRDSQLSCLVAESTCISIYR